LDRLRANLGGAGLTLGGIVASIATVFAWVSVTNTATHQTTKEAAIRQAFGQSVFLLGIIILAAGVGVLASAGRGRILWAIVGLICSLLVLAAALVGVFSPAALGQIFATREAAYQSGVITRSGATETVKEAFDSGLLTASIKLGAWIGLIGGALGSVCAVISLFRPQNRRGGLWEVPSDS
jgi:hypothetical protein